MMLLFSFSSHAVSQVFDKHLWEDRVIVIHADGFSMPDLKKQLEILGLDTAGLKERKLVIYQVMGREYKTGLSASTNVQVFPHPMKYDIKAFTIQLIGLDGGVKLEKNHPVSLPEIFGLIDRMPMRRAELSEKGKEGQGDH